MAERSSNIGSGAVAVIGQGLAVNSDASWAVAFVGERFVVGSIFAGAERPLSIAVLILSLGNE